MIKNLQGKLLQYEGKDIGCEPDRDSLIGDLHHMCTNWTVMIQDLACIENKIEFLRKTYQRCSEVYPQSEPSPWESRKGTEKEFSLAESNVEYEMDDLLAYLESRCSMYRGWASNYLNRTKTRIQLIFHLSNQEETRTNSKIAKSTKELAEKTQRDSASMITIATVTMFFLPMTLVSSVISGIFFDYGLPSENASKLWWVFPTIVIPLTITVFSIWGAWLRWRRRRDFCEIMSLDEEQGPANQ